MKGTYIWIRPNPLIWSTLEFTDFTLFSTTLKQWAWLNGVRPFEDSVIAPHRSQYFSGTTWERGFLWAHMRSDSMSNGRCCFFHTQDSQVPESRDRNGNGTDYYPQWSISKILPLVPVNVCSAGLKVLVPKEEILPPRDTTHWLHWTES